MDLDLAFLSAGELAAGLISGDLSPIQVVENALERIDQVNPSVNAFTDVFRDGALEEAANLERRWPLGVTRPALFGVPIAIKAMTPIAGKRWTRGSTIYGNTLAARSAVIVERLQRAGAIIVGTTTTSEFAVTGFVRTRAHGVTRNPWNLKRSPGGSSAGSAVAVATGCVALAEGSDAGGSVRIPAAFCGCVGMKPSFGRIPFDILDSQFETLWQHGPLARTVDDAALFLDCTNGSDDRDHFSLPGRISIDGPFDVDLSEVRIGVSRDLGFLHCEPDVLTNFAKTIDLVRSAGAFIEDVSIPWRIDIYDAWEHEFNSQTAAAYGHLLRDHRDDLDPGTVDVIERGMRCSGVDVKRSALIRTQQWRGVAPLLHRYDALLCPTTTRGAPAIDASQEEFEVFTAEGKFQALDLTFPFNLIPSCPALTIPNGFTAEHLPTGVQIVGGRHKDVNVLRIGAAIQSLLRFEGRPPNPD
jgi:Asp-tRNA(Asn)/Glu-tRNA(Gln) amidotransferase A subunit family amidase